MKVGASQLLQPEKASYLDVFYDPIETCLDVPVGYPEPFTTLLQKPGKSTEAEKELRLLDLPFVVKPGYGIFVIYYADECPPLVLIIPADDKAVFYESLRTSVEPLMNERSAKKISWYGDNVNMHRQQLRLGAYDQTNEIRDFMYRIAYGATAYDLDKAFNVSQCEAISEDFVAEYVIEPVISLWKEACDGFQVSDVAVSIERTIALPIVYRNLCAYRSVGIRELVTAYKQAHKESNS